MSGAGVCPPARPPRAEGRLGLPSRPSARARSSRTGSAVSGAGMRPPSRLAQRGWAEPALSRAEPALCSREVFAGRVGVGERGDTSRSAQGKEAMVEGLGLGTAHAAARFPRADFNEAD